MMAIFNFIQIYPSIQNGAEVFLDIKVLSDLVFQVQVNVWFIFMIKSTLNRGLIFLLYFKSHSKCISKAIQDRIDV